jgi:hypothetical protein
MAYTELQSAYLFHRRNGKARAIRAAELARLDVANAKRRYPRGLRNSVCNPVIDPARAHSWTQCRWIENVDAIGLREVGFADEILSLRHTGWFADAFQETTLRGQVWQLPARKGSPLFVYGYADAENPGAALVCFDIERGEHGEDDQAKREAARHGDSMAEAFAEAEREYSEAWQAARQWGELADDMAKARAKAKALVADMRAAIKAGQLASAAICEALRSQVRAYAGQWEEARTEREELAANFHYWQDGKSLSIAEFAKVNL